MEIRHVWVFVGVIGAEKTYIVDDDNPATLLTPLWDAVDEIDARVFRLVFQLQVTWPHHITIPIPLDS